MMWSICFFVSIGCLFLSVIFAVIMNQNEYAKKRRFSIFRIVLAGVFVAALFMFFPIHVANEGLTVGGGWRGFCLSLFNSMQVFTLGCEFNVVKEGMQFVVALDKNSLSIGGGQGVWTVLDDKVVGNGMNLEREEAIAVLKSLLNE